MPNHDYDNLVTIGLISCMYTKGISGYTALSMQSAIGYPDMIKPYTWPIS